MAEQVGQISGFSSILKQQNVFFSYEILYGIPTYKGNKISTDLVATEEFFVTLKVYNMIILFLILQISQEIGILFYFQKCPVEGNINN